MTQGATGGQGIGRTAFEMKRELPRSLDRCLVCVFADVGMKDHIDALFYERVTDVRTREIIREARGFCRFHARAVSQHADALGTSLILADVLTNDLRDLQNGVYDRPGSRTGGPFRFFSEREVKLPRRAACPLCAVEEELEGLATDSVLDGLRDAEFTELFERSNGLCVPHFRLAYERCRDEARWDVIVRVQREALTRVTAALSELARKYDYRSHEKPQGAEAEVWRRGLDMTSRQIGD